MGSAHNHSVLPIKKDIFLALYFLSCVVSRLATDWDLPSSFMSCCDKKFTSLPAETTSAHQLVFKHTNELTLMEVT